MPEKGKKYFLRNLLRIMQRYPEREDITEKRISKLLKKVHDFTFELGCRLRKRGSGDEREGEIRQSNLSGRLS